MGRGDVRHQKGLKRPPKRRNYLTPSNIPARERQRPGRGRRTTCNTKKRCTDFATAIISSPRASGSSAPNWKGCPWSCCRTTTAGVIARSNEAKALGIRMGHPYFQIRDLEKRHNVAVFSSNFNLYGDMSRRVIWTLRRMVPAAEVYSIDEAFLDLRGIETGRLEELGRHISRTVRRNTGIPVSIGIAPTKTLAKIASKLCKEYPKLQGACLMDRPQDIEKVLRKFPMRGCLGHRAQAPAHVAGRQRTYGMGLRAASRGMDTRPHGGHGAAHMERASGRGVHRLRERPAGQTADHRLAQLRARADPIRGDTHLGGGVRLDGRRETAPPAKPLRRG